MMNIEIHNLGPVRECNIKIGDLTVLFSPPNSGKSYSLKAIYSTFIGLDPIVLKSVVAEVLVSEPVAIPSVVQKKFRSILLTIKECIKNYENLYPTNELDIKYIIK